MVWTYHHYEIGDIPLLFGYAVYIHLFFFFFFEGPEKNNSKLHKI